MMGHWKVLLVDDEEEFVSTLAERLRLRGIEAQAACDGEEALRSLETDSTSGNGSRCDDAGIWWPGSVEAC
jgi:ActR/RegA family two-component response regulator